MFFMFLFMLSFSLRFYGLRFHKNAFQVDQEIIDDFKNVLYILRAFGNVDSINISKE